MYKYEIMWCIKFILALVSFVFACGCETAPLYRGYRWYRRGAYEQSVKALTYYIEHSSDSSRNKEARAVGFFYRGLAKAELGRIQEAEVDYMEALARVPDFFYASFNIGVGYINQKQYGLALAMFRKSWNSILKAGRGELDESQLWNRNVFFRDRAYCFLYYGMTIVMCGKIDELGVLLNESDMYTFEVKKVSMAQEVFRKISSRKLSIEEGCIYVESWLKDFEKRKGVGKLRGF